MLVILSEQEVKNKLDSEHLNTTILLLLLQAAQEKTTEKSGLCWHGILGGMTENVVSLLDWNFTFTRHMLLASPKEGRRFHSCCS